MPRSNIEQLIATAEVLRPLLGDLVFLGGAVTAVLVTDPGAGAPRPTLDVDAIAEITSYAQYSAFGEKLRALGFAEDPSVGAPVCRWVQTGLILDVMPLNDGILGFSNRWYPAAMETAVKLELSPSLEIRVVTAPYFLATKLEAFLQRGKHDVLASHDLEDVIFVVDGRPSLINEILAEPRQLREYLSRQIASLMRVPSFLDALPGYMLPDQASQARIEIVMRRLEAIAL
jgi:hypothetical protein